MMGNKVKRGLLSLYVVFLIFTSGFVGLFIINELVDDSGALAAQTHYVDVNGNGNFTTIQAAINSANSGDTIHVWAGIYYESIVVSKTLTLIGNGTENTTIHGNFVGTVVYISANFVNFSGFRLKKNNMGYYGLVLNNVQNCIISNNKVTNDSRGIDLQSSSNNKIENNHCTDNFMGISIVDSDCNIVTNNTCENNWGDGIYLETSYNNLIKNNNCSSNPNNWGIRLNAADDNLLINNSCNNNNWHGIYLYKSENNTLINNSMEKNGIYIWGLTVAKWNSHNIDGSNKINGKPVYYYKDQSGIKVPANAGQVILANCSNMRIENQNVSDCGIGVILGFSSNNYLAKNTAFDNLNGMHLKNASNNVFINNSCRSNTHGVNLQYSDHNTFANNIFDHNEDHGIWSEYSQYNTFINNSISNNWVAIELFEGNNKIINNTCKSNLNYGMMIHSDNNVITNNYCSNNRFDGIILAGSDGNFVANNTCNSQKYGNGLRVSQSKHNTVVNNTCLNNIGSNGIEVFMAEQNILTDNICNSNNKDGISEIDSEFITYNNNTCNSNGEYGLHIKSSDSNILNNNTLNSNDLGGLYIESSNSNMINYTVCNSNNDAGIQLWSYTNNNSIINNSCAYNDYGIRLYSSKDNLLKNNSCVSNFGYGIILEQSNYNEVVNNSILENSISGIYSLYSTYNTIKNNNCTLNAENGIYIRNSLFNTIKDNICFDQFDGIELYESDENSVINNKCTGNLYNGIYVQKSFLNNIEYNTCTFNGYGIFLIESDSNSLNRNFCEDNNKDGLQLSSSHYNSISNGTFNTNSWNGIGLDVSHLNNIDSNTCDKNDESGIISYYSNENSFNNNSCINNYHDLELRTSENNKITNNICVQNTIDGIYFEKSNYNILTRNNGSSNKAAGIRLSDQSNYNTITENMIQENDIGFDIPSGDFSKIYHNNIIDNENQISVDGDNYWDNGNGQGNYWSDYNGIDNGANGREAGDGVGDTEIPHLGYDHFPLMAPYGQVVILAPLLMAPGKTDDDGSYLLSWISNVDVDGFSLQEDDNEQFISPSIIYSGNNGSIDNYQINGKAEGTYYYRLRAHREGNYSTWSNIVNITVLYPIKPPSNLLAQVWPEGNALNISWDTAGDDTLSYELYLKASGLWSDIPFVIFDHPTHSFDHTDLVDGIEYFYKLRLKSVLGQYSEFSEPVSAVPQDTMPPDAPTNLQLADKTYYSIDITWAESTASDIEGYNVYRSNVSNPKDKGVPINDKELIRDTYYTDTGLDEGTSYYYMITGVDEVPNESPGSSFFEARTYLSIEYPQRPSINRSQPDIAIPEDTYDDSSINLIEWFSDINNDVLSFYCVDQKHINVTINQDTGSVLLKPEQNWNGQEKLTFFAFDGVYQTSDDVIVSITAVNDPPNKPEIITPKDGIELVSGTKLDLKASCTDPDLMYGDGLTFSWSSNIDGMLGEGAILSGVSLSIGQHLIKVAVSDSENKTASRSINVTILASSDHQDEKNINDDSTIVIFVGGIIIVIIIVLILILFLYQRKKKQAGLKNTGYAESQYASIEPATRSKYPVQKRVKRPKRIRREETFESDDEDEMEFIDWSEDEE